MIRLLYFAVFVVPMTIFSGCHKAESPRSEFLRICGSDATNYIELYEVSPEIIQKNEKDTLIIATNIVNNIRQDISICYSNNNCPELVQRLDRIEKANQRYYEYRMQLINQIKESYDPKKDVILYYDYKSSESGWIVLSDGLVKKRIELNSPR